MFANMESYNSILIAHGRQRKRYRQISARTKTGICNNNEVEGCLLFYLSNRLIFLPQIEYNWIALLRFTGQMLFGREERISE